jgi:hypothetical protein
MAAHNHVHRNGEDNMPRVKSVRYLGYPDSPTYVGEIPFRDITVLPTGPDEITLILDDEECAYAGHGWGLFIEMSEREAHLLSLRLDQYLVHRHPTG